MFIQRKNFRAGVSTAEKVAGFPCSKRTPTVHQFSRQFLALFESEFFALYRAALYR